MMDVEIEQQGSLYVSAEMLPDRGHMGFRCDLRQCAGEQKVATVCHINQASATVRINQYSVGFLLDYSLTLRVYITFEYIHSISY